MKIQKILFALAIVSLAFVSCKTEAKKETPTQEIVNAADAKQVAINISGMTCEIGCAKTIESKLSKHAGVIDAKVIFNDSIATVKYDASKTNKASLIAFVGGIAGGMYTATETPMKACTGKKGCNKDCSKACCKDKDGKTCTADTKKACCKGKKACDANCEKACCKGKDGKTCTADAKKISCEAKKACDSSCEKACCKDKK